MPLQFEELRDDRLDQRGNRECIVDAGLRIADPDFEGVEKRMEANVPPDLFCIIDAARFHEQPQVFIIFSETFKGVRNAGAREAFEHLQAVTFQAGVPTHPEGRVNRKRVDMGQE